MRERALLFDGRLASPTAGLPAVVCHHTKERLAGEGGIRKAWYWIARMLASNK
jgi:hypothetical protein